MATVHAVGISIHAPPRGATTPTTTERSSSKNFNSRPSARGDEVLVVCRRAAIISIHAPPRGATFPASESPGVGKISIHAPPRGATHRAPAGDSRNRYFNSRPSARGDNMGARTVRLNIISIHAPPRGATPQAPTPQLGGIFQFTPLREGRPRRNRERHPGQSISIHAPPRGATTAVVVRVRVGLISIHAPPRGATFCGFSTTFTLQISIHAPPRGATHPGGASRHAQANFNSRPSARGDSTRSARTSPDPFQFTPLREGRRVRPRTWLPAHRHFNSRPSARGDG